MIYGEKWVRHYGDIPSEPNLELMNKSAIGRWAQYLKNIPEQQIKSAIVKCASSGKEWPPSLPGFIGMCSQSNMPSLDEAVIVIANLGDGRTTEEPLFLRIINDPGFDRFSFRMMSMSDARNYMRSFYDRHQRESVSVAIGFNGEEQAKLGRD